MDLFNIYGGYIDIEFHMIIYILHFGVNAYMSNYRVPCGVMILDMDFILRASH